MLAGLPAMVCASLMDASYIAFDSASSSGERTRFTQARRMPNSSRS
jgi:hypothetical protein